jgi:predicted RNase H-like nuclease (RuvC/YqgF family)
LANNDEISQAHLDELNDRVDDLQDIDGAAAGDRDETMSRVSRGSRFSAIPKSEISRLSNKTYIQHLQSELDEEKAARLKLEKELEELKKLSSEISSHLGLNRK